MEYESQQKMEEAKKKIEMEIKNIYLSGIRDNNDGNVQVHEFSGL
jgi:translation initiation factor IF-3